MGNSKKRTQQKTAVFPISPDGFSIHTFELSRQLTKIEYQSIKEHLFQQQEHEHPAESWFYKDGKHRYVCRRYSNYGIRINLQRFEQDNYIRYALKMIINPRKLITPECSYLGILPPTDSAIHDLRKAFKKVFQNSVFENDLDQYKLSRLDFCTNLHCSRKQLFRELIRLHRKLPVPDKYERVTYQDKDKKKANRYNKHYLKYTCGTHNLVIYDKTYQMPENGLDISYEKLPDGVLRLEMQCTRDYLRKQEKKLGEPETTDLLLALLPQSQSTLMKKFTACFPVMTFLKPQALEAAIQNSVYKQCTKARMIELAQKLQRVQSVDTALTKLDYSAKDGQQLLNRFKKLGLSPVPLRKDFCTPMLPSLAELLQCAAEQRELQVAYEVVKYK